MTHLDIIGFWNKYWKYHAINLEFKSFSSELPDEQYWTLTKQRLLSKKVSKVKIKSFVHTKDLLYTQVHIESVDTKSKRTKQFRIQ